MKFHKLPVKVKIQQILKIKLYEIIKIARMCKKKFRINFLLYEIKKSFLYPH
jgi:hypothetical protein